MRLLHGRHPVVALLETRPKSVRRLLLSIADAPLEALACAAGVAVERVPRDRLELLAKNPQHQGIVAEADDFTYAGLEEVVRGEGPPLVLALDSVQDPHNLGALARSAECFGATGLVIPQDRAAQVTATASKASAGAVERLPVAQVVNLVRALEALKEKGLWVTGLAGEGAGPLGAVDLTGPTVLVVGAEGEGLRPLVRRACDRLAYIPMTGRTGSLNAAVAGGIALSEAFGQRRGRVGTMEGKGARENA
jgi:23S rRNA (guanosine2251-2'-O)-methyltransferase